MKKMLLKNVLLNGSNVCITIENGKITAAAPDIPQTPDMEVFDGQGKLGVLPPFYNAHNHAAMTLLRSYAEDMELFDWLSNHIWPAEAKLSAEDIYIGTKLAAMEMIRSGTVWFNDSYWHPEAAVRAVRETGMRATLGMLYLNGVSDDAARANELLIEAAQDVDLISVSHTPHAIYTVDKPTLQNIAKMLEKDGRRLHIHVSETAKEVADCQKEHGMTPVEYLDSLGLLSERAMLAHCVHLSDRDREIIAERQAYIAHNPVSNMKLCSGMFDFEKAQAAGCRIAIGTDGTSSNNNLSMLDEMKCAALTAKVVSGKPTAGRNLDIFRAATVTGARYAGVQSGCIAPGYVADLLLVELDHLLLSAGHDLYADMVYAADAGVINSVICNGKFLMKNHIIPGETETIAEFRKVCKKLRQTVKR
ncbi:MAG: amidohydrolase [Lentisphaeria bacterium]|nr:amidohydrolase [Lentisphaeria bacterium]